LSAVKLVPAPKIRERASVVAPQHNFVGARVKNDAAAAGAKAVKPNVGNLGRVVHDVLESTVTLYLAGIAALTKEKIERILAALVTMEVRRIHFVNFVAVPQAQISNQNDAAMISSLWVRFFGALGEVHAGTNATFGAGAEFLRFNDGLGCTSGCLMVAQRNFSVAYVSLMLPVLVLGHVHPHAVETIDSNELRNVRRKRRILLSQQAEKHLIGRVVKPLTGSLVCKCMPQRIESERVPSSRHKIPSHWQFAEDERRCAFEVTGPGVVQD
jgi:hypothetical protein